jgi:hypothetical protein
LNRFLSRRTAPFRRILLVESGSRSIAEGWLGWLNREHPQASVDLLTCYDGEPQNYDGARGAVFSTNDYRTDDARQALMTEFLGNRYDVVAIICADEPVMTKWKWYTALKLKCKVVIINENGDWFWLDRGNWDIVRKFVAFRSGLSGSGALLQPLRLLAFPFTLTYLLLYALAVHTRRKVFS